MRERRNDLEITNGCRELLRRSKLGSISSLRCQKSRKRVCEDNECEVMFGAGLSASTKAIANQTLWWSQTGSNRRPHACKARALPADLCPRTRRRMQRTRSKWWAWEDLNFRPHAYQARALTN